MRKRRGRDVRMRITKQPKQVARDPTGLITLG